MADTADDLRFKAVATGTANLSTWHSRRNRPLASYTAASPALASGATWTVTHNLLEPNPWVTVIKTSTNSPADLAFTPAGSNAVTTTVNSAYPAGAFTVTVTSRRPAPLVGAQLMGPPTTLGNWHSGVAIYGGKAADQFGNFGSWRGRAADVIVTYCAYNSWDAIAGSGWAADLLKGVPGRVKTVIGVPLLASDGSSTFADVAAGKRDTEFKKLAAAIAASSPNSVLRLAWEMNGAGWYQWQPTKDQATDFKSAYKRVAKLFKAASSGFKIDFTITSNNPLKGDSARNGVFDLLYPGDDVVDIIGCDHYDFNAIISKDAAAWAKACRPSQGPGLDDVVDFARAHGKPVSVPEWGCVMPDHSGPGDNPFFVSQMRAWFEAHADILAYEAYYNDNGEAITSLLWSYDKSTVSMPNSAAMYRSLWGSRA